MGIVPCNSPGIATHQNSETKISSQIILSGGNRLGYSGIR